MRAVVYAGEGSVRVDEVPRPRVQDAGDAVVEVTLTSICGSDLHLLAGKTPGMRTGGTIGHEFVGVVRDAGDGALDLVGRRVVGSFLIACGDCSACRGARYNHCSERRALGLGTLAGDLDGAQAEFVRVPNAPLNLKPLESFTGIEDEAAVFCGDVLVAGFHAAAIAGVGAGETCAVVGAGPVGLCCALAVAAAGAQVVVVDADGRRRRFAREVYGFEAHESLPDGAVDVAIDAVGAVEALKSALRAVRDGGRVAIVGVYGAERYDLPLGRIWVRGLDLRFSGMANVHAFWEDALGAASTGAVDPTRLVTHRLALDDAVEGYELFRSRSAMKVLLRP